MSNFIITFDPYNSFGFRRDRQKAYEGDSYIVNEDGTITIVRTTAGKTDTVIASGKWLSIEQE